jgi:hypothetical protein
MLRVAVFICAGDADVCFGCGDRSPAERERVLVRQFARDAWAESVSRFTWPKVTPTARAAETKMLSSFCCFAMLPP